MTALAPSPFRAVGHGGRPYILDAHGKWRITFLHAAWLAFPHPITGERIETESPLPADLAAALEAARGA